MSDKTAATETAADPQGTAAEPTPEQSATPASETTDWKAEARKWEQRAKDNHAAANKLAEIEEAQKTEIQKATEALERAEAALAAKEAETLRLTVASKHGITGDYADLLHGADENELEAAAKKIRSLIESAGTSNSKGSVGPYVPPEGSTPSADALNGDPLLADLKSKLGIS